MNNSKFKKIILILVFLLVILVIAFLIWNTFFKPSPEAEEPILKTDPETGMRLPLSPEGEPIIVDDTPSKPIDTSPDTPSQTSPVPTLDDSQQEIKPTASGGITKTDTLVNTSSLKPSLTSDGNSVQFYNQSDGKFYITNERGDLIPLSDKVFHNVQDITWAPDKKRAVLEYPDESKIIYNFETEKQVSLPKHWEDFSFSSDSREIVNKSLGIDPDNRWLVISNSDGSETRALEFIGMNDDKVISSWSPNNQSVAIYKESIDYNREEVFFVGKHGENFKSTIVEGWGFEHEWSEQGDKLLYSAASPREDLIPELWTVNAQGDSIGSNRKRLNLETWASKCNFANNDEVYCAVPRNLKEGSGLYPEMALETFDDLYKINIQTGQKKLIATPEKALNISDLIVSSDQRNIFFTDHINGQIHKIKLK
jgi:hypothetical protein